MILYASGRIGLYNIVTSIVGLLILPLSYYTLKLGYPPYTIYFLSFVVSVLVQISSIFIMKYKIGISIGQYIKLVLVPIFVVLVCSVPIPVILRFIIPYETLRIVLVFFSSIVCVLLSSYLLGLTKPERSLCVQFVSNFVNKLRKSNNQIIK